MLHKNYTGGIISLVLKLILIKYFHYTCINRQMKTPRPVKDPADLPLVIFDLPLGYDVMHAVFYSACCMKGMQS